jgi:peptidyl-prolyl cis-trans isomerase SurA
MFWRTVLFCHLAIAAYGAVVLDRVAIIVGRRVVKASDVDRDLRASQFVNREPLNVSPEAKRKITERLIDQELIRQEIMGGGYSRPTEQEAVAFLQQLKKDRTGGSDAQFAAALAKYGLTEEQLRQYLHWQLTVLRFIDERFRPGVLVTDEDVKAYYEQNRAQLEKAYPKNNSFEALDPRIRDIIAGERVNKLFNEWLDQVRRNTRIQMREAAFTADTSTGVSK